MKLSTFIVLAFSFALNAHASAPKAAAGTNPGFYRFTVGDIEVNTISDGTFMMNVSKILVNITPKELDAALKKNFLGQEIETSVDAFLINTGDSLHPTDLGTYAFGSWFASQIAKLCLPSVK